ncbi:unnamed protein product [Arctogadus glacialis]
MLSRVPYTFKAEGSFGGLEMNGMNPQRREVTSVYLHVPPSAEPFSAPWNSEEQVETVRVTQKDSELDFKPLGGSRGRGYPTFSEGFDLQPPGPAGVLLCHSEYEPILRSKIEPREVTFLENRSLISDVRRAVATRGVSN